MTQTLYTFRIEQQANLLWINSDSLYNVNENWLAENFKKNQRQQVVIVKGENVLSKESVNKVTSLVKCSLLNLLSMFIDVRFSSENSINNI